MADGRCGLESDHFVNPCEANRLHNFAYYRGIRDAHGQRHGPSQPAAFQMGRMADPFDPNSSDERPRDKDIITSVTKGGS